VTGYIKEKDKFKMMPSTCKMITHLLTWHIYFYRMPTLIKYFTHISTAAGCIHGKAEIWPAENQVQFMAVFIYYYYFLPPLILIYHA
jgi:hypothetical protein